MSNPICTVILGIACLTAGCSNQAIPDCPHPNTEPAVRSAGCLVVTDNTLLVIREMTGKISIPGGSGEHDESGRCSAVRETWEETGLQVRAEQLVRQFDNGFHLYRCVLTGDSTPDPQFTHEVREAFWLDSTSFDQHRWRFPDQKIWLKDYLLSQ